MPYVTSKEHTSKITKKHLLKMSPNINTAVPTGRNTVEDSINTADDNTFTGKQSPDDIEK